MEKDYQRIHKMADDAVKYAEGFGGWHGLHVEQLQDKNYKLTIEWDEDDTKTA